MKKAVPVAKALSDVRLVSSDTPWGKAQSAEEIGPGILKYSTASHGGYFLDTIANAKVSPIFKKATFCQQGMRGWYEEDCDWAIVVYTFKEFFDSKTYKIALKTIKEHHSDALHQLQKTFVFGKRILIGCGKRNLSRSEFVVIPFPSSCVR